MQKNPFPVYPGRQEQEYEPSVLAQLAYEWHSCGPLHSSTSESTKHWKQFYHDLAGKLVKEFPETDQLQRFEERNIISKDLVCKHK